jgi:hypothetical protein
MPVAYITAGECTVMYEGGLKGFVISYIIDGDISVKQKNKNVPLTFIYICA